MLIYGLIIQEINTEPRGVTIYLTYDGGDGEVIQTLTVPFIDNDGTILINNSLKKLRN